MIWIVVLLPLLQYHVISYPVAYIITASLFAVMVAYSYGRRQ